MTAENGPWQKAAAEFQKILAKGKLVPSSQGSGGAYLLLDATNTKRYIVKPFDEDMLCLNNRKQRASPFRDTLHRVRNAIPLYETPNRELAASALASILHIQDITPFAMMLIVRSDAFYDISEALDEQYRENFVQRTRPADKEKLCSVQPFINEAIELGEAMHEWFEARQERAEEPLPLDQESFENANLLVWAAYDCDGHGSNFLLYLNNLDAEGRAIYGLKKIDNGLCFPGVNKYLINYLAYLPNAKLPISSSLREKIAHIDCEAVLRMLRFYDLPDTATAFLARVRVLQELAKRNMTIEEMNLRMESLSLPRGEELALAECSREELEKLFIQKDQTRPTWGATKSMHSLLQKN